MIDIYMMFDKLILSLGETGALFGPHGIEDITHGDGNCRVVGLVAALADCERESVGSASEWKPGSDRCGTLIGADWRMEWWCVSWGVDCVSSCGG